MVKVRSSVSSAVQTIQVHWQRVFERNVYEYYELVSLIGALEFLLSECRKKEGSADE